MTQIVSALFVDIILPNFSKGLRSIISRCSWKGGCFCQASTVSDIAGPGYSEVDGTGTGVETDNTEAAGIGTIDNDEPEGAEGKVDITTLDKTNKIPILISY